MVPQDQVDAYLKQIKAEDEKLFAEQVCHNQAVLNKGGDIPDDLVLSFGDNEGENVANPKEAVWPTIEDLYSRMSTQQPNNGEDMYGYRKKWHPSATDKQSVDSPRFPRSQTILDTEFEGTQISSVQAPVLNGKEKAVDQFDQCGTDVRRAIREHQDVIIRMSIAAKKILRFHARS